VLRYSVNQIGLPGTSFEEDVRLLERLAVPALGVVRPKLVAAGPKEAARLLDASGLAVSVLLGAGGFPLEDPTRWVGPMDDLRRALDEAATIGAPWVLVSSGPAGVLSYEEAETRFHQVLDIALPEAADRGVGLVFEPNQALRVDLGYVHTLHDGLDLADSIDSAWFTVVAEVNNCWIERRLYENISRRTVRIGLVQINDFAAGTLCTPHRVPLGEGIIPLPRILTAFVEAGYSGYFDIEVVGPVVAQLGGAETTRRCVDYLRRLDL
jgi:sugar phosphate isomerase/epimerase